MATVGFAFLVIAFAAAVVAAATLLAGHFAEKAALSRIGRVGVAASASVLRIMNRSTIQRLIPSTT